MNYSILLNQLIEDNAGIISTKMVTELGIPRVYLNEFVKKGLLMRYDRGIYISTKYAYDEFFCFQMRHQQTIFSHESALFLHDYIEEAPKLHIVTVKTGTNTKNLINSVQRVHSVKNSFFLLGKENLEDKYGRIVCTYDIERTICDIIRNRSKVKNDVIIATLKKYIISSNNNCTKLFYYAEILKVTKALNRYLEFMK